MRQDKNKTRQLVLTAMLFATAIVFSIVESMIPMPLPVPGVKFGLSNIVVMYALLFMNRKSALAIAILKGIFSAMTRGAVAGLLSLTGGLFSIIIMIILMMILKEKGTYFIYSMFGAVFHNVGQFVAISLIYTNIALWYYLPVLMVAGIAAGIVTSVLLKFILPALQRLGLK